MRSRWIRRLALASAGVAVCLVPFIGSLAHGHAHHEAEEAHAHIADLVQAPVGPSLASHAGQDHPHLPSADATLSRISHDWAAVPVAVTPLPALRWSAPGVPAPAPADPRPQRTHDPPAAPRAPPIA